LFTPAALYAGSIELGAKADGEGLAVGDIQDNQLIKHLNGVPSFDYGGISSSVASFLRGQADRIRRYVGTSIVKTGKDLLAAKHYLSHGVFLRWVESEVGIPARTAQGYMQVAQWAASKDATVAHLPPSVLYTLSARSTPKEFTNDVLKRIDAGEHIPPHCVRRELKVFRQARLNKRDRRTEREPLKLNGKATLIDAVSILRDRLSAIDFVRIREILTSKQVLDDPHLPLKILAAFQTTEGRDLIQPVALKVVNHCAGNEGDVAGR
jgi:hypothetical protein